MGMGSWELRVPQTDKHLPQSPFTGHFCSMTTFCIAFYKSYISTVFTINVCMKDTLLV
jgi:hypothetical protein